MTHEVMLFKTSDDKYYPDNSVVIYLEVDQEEGDDFPMLYAKADLFSDVSGTSLYLGYDGEGFYISGQAQGLSISYLTTVIGWLERLNDLIEEYDNDPVAVAEIFADDLKISGDENGL